MQNNIDDTETINQREQMVAKEKPFSCPKCNKKFVYLKWVVNHLKKDNCEKVIKLKICPICDKPIKTNYFKKHMKTHTVEMVKCKECKCLFKSETTLAAHVKGVHGQRPKVAAKCVECDKEFIDERLLKQHVSKKHMDRKIKCDQCVMRFATKNGLRKHMKGHREFSKLLENENQIDGSFDSDSVSSGGGLADDMEGDSDD